VRDEKKIELVLELTRWTRQRRTIGLGIDEMVYPILEVPGALLRIPSRRAATSARSIEVAARNRCSKVRATTRRGVSRAARPGSGRRGERRWRDDVE